MNDNLKITKEDVVNYFCSDLDEIKKELTRAKKMIKSLTNVDDINEYLSNVQMNLQDICETFLTELYKFEYIEKEKVERRKRLRKYFLIKYLRDEERKTFGDISKYFKMSPPTISATYQRVCRILNSSDESSKETYEKISKQVVKDYLEGKYIVEIKTNTNESPKPKILLTEEEKLLQFAEIYYFNKILNMTFKDIRTKTKFTHKILREYKSQANYHQLFRNAKFWEAYQTYLTKNNIKV